MSNPLKKLAGQTVIYGLGSILPRVINYLFSLALTYIFKTPSDLASNTTFYSYISFANIVFTYGLETAFFNFSNKLEDKNKVYSTTLISLFASTAFLTSLVILFSSNIAGFMDYPENSNFVIWCALIVATDTITAIPSARLRLVNNAKKFTLIKISNVLVYLLISTFYLVFCKNAYENNETGFLANCYNPTIGVGYAFLAQLIANLFNILFLAKEFTGFDYVFDFDLWKKIMKYAWPLIILGLAGMVNETFDRIILDRMLPKNISKTELGIYGACYKISILMTIFIQAFKYAAEPFFFSKSQDKNSKILNALVMKYFVIFCSIIFLFTTLNLDIIKLVISSEYRVGLGVAPILLLANLFLGVYLNLSIWYKLTGQTKFGALVTIIGALITLFITFTFIPKYSYMACAWATFAAYLSMMVISYLLGKKFYPVNYNLRAIGLFFIIALGFYFLSLTWSNIDSKFLKLLLNNILFLIYIYLFYKLEFNNIKKIKNNDFG